MVAGLYKGFLANVVRSVGGALVLAGSPDHPRPKEENRQSPETQISTPSSPYQVLYDRAKMYLNL